MTTEELNTIVAAVVAELEKSGVDFDYKAKEAKDDDLVFVIRGTAPNYQGVTVTWKGLLDIITDKATQAKNDAETAKNAANTILEQVQSKGTEITNFVATSKAELETQKNESVNAVKSVYQTDLNELKGDLDTEMNARIEADNALSTSIHKVEVSSSVNRYEIDNLKAKAEGKLYRTETVEAEAYTVDVPSSVAPYAEVQNIGGKSVVWNQLRQSYNIRTEYGITVSSNGDGTINIQGTATITPDYNQFSITNYMNFKRDGRKYLITSNLEIPNGFGVSGHEVHDTKDFIFSRNEGSDWYGTVYIKITEGDVLNINNLSINIIDLTQMFGSGNEPTLEECKKIFSEDYYPYDAGTIRSFPVKTVRSVNAEGTEIGSIDVSSVTSDLKSAGSVHDEWSNGKVTKRVGSVDLGTLDYSLGTDGNGKHFFSTRIDNFKSSNDSGYICKTLSKIFTPTSWNIINWTDATKNLIATYMDTIGFFYVPLGDSTDVNAFKSAMLGVMLYYELAEPIEEEVPEIDNYIEVEGGGTLTFESDDAVHMPVPSTDRFVVNLTSTTEETV